MNQRLAEIAPPRLGNAAQSEPCVRARSPLRLQLVVSVALLALAGEPGRAVAQAMPERGSLRGVVRSAPDEAVAFAIVALEPGFGPRFTDDSGAFAFAYVGPGTYRLVARQVGFKPLDTMVVAPRDSTLVLTLEHLVIRLSEVNVVGGPWRCTDPGEPDPAAAPELAAVFAQLRENAERYWMFADSYPAAYWMERRFGDPDGRGGVVTSRVDTVGIRTDTRWHYAPGRLLAQVRGPRGGMELQLNLPTLPDFADPVFLQNHCFSLAGLDTLEGGSYVRLDFRAAERITTPDAEGSAFLDPWTYLIRFATVRLTRPERLGLTKFEASVWFREIVPSLVLPARIWKDQTAYERLVLIEHTEDQRTVALSFLRPLPRHR
jgi:hypothetical protein